MNVSLDTASLLMMILNFVFIIIGVLIKMELHDIKSRIVRLENLFLHPNNKHHVERILAPILLLLLTMEVFP